jgi:hypothetical protein
MWHIGQSQARGLEGEGTLGMAHGCPPDVPDPKLKDSIIWEQEIVDPKALVHTFEAQGPVIDEVDRRCPEPWSRLGIVTVDSDACTRASVLLKGV